MSSTIAAGKPPTPYGATTPSTEEAPKEIKKDGLKARLLAPMQRRHFMAMMGFLGFMNIYAMRVNLSIAILDMTNNSTITYPNGTSVFKPAEFYWNKYTQGVILGSFFFGYLVTQIPGGWLAGRYGGKLLYGFGIFGTALLTLLTPPVAHMGKYFLIFLRVVEGLCEGVTYPAMHAIWSHWAPPLEKTKLATIAFSGSYFGTVISMPLSAWLADKFGWPSVFYVFGLLSILWCSAWFKLVTETPSEDKKISQEELSHIQRSVGFTFEQVARLEPRKDGHRKARGQRPIQLCGFSFEQRWNTKPPWKDILLSRPVWAIIVAHFCENWGFYTMITFLPRFAQDYLHFTIKQAGVMTALPYLAMGTVVLMAGQLADYLREKKSILTVVVRKSFTCGAFVCQSVFIVVAAHSINIGMAVACITIAIGCGGFAWSGFSVNHLDIAPQYASVLMGLSNTFATLPGMISPPLAGWIVTGGENWHWHLVFYIAAGFYAIGAISYAILGSGERQPWAELPGGYLTQLDEMDMRLDSPTTPVSEREQID